MEEKKSTGKTKDSRKGKEASGGRKGVPACFVTELDQYLFGQGNHYDIFRKLGAHPASFRGKEGVYFAVWAPHAWKVHVTGEFNDWDIESHEMKRLEPLGIWELFVPGVKLGALYKYLIETEDHRQL